MRCSGFPKRSRMYRRYVVPEFFEDLRGDLELAVTMETGVDNATAASAVVEFERFLELKKLANDRDGTLVAPSPVVRAVFRRATLHTRRYRDLCHHLCGFFVDFDPRDELRADEDEFQLRYCSTWVALERVWGVPDPLVWPEPPGANHGIPVRAWVEEIEERRSVSPGTRALVLMSVPIPIAQQQQHQQQAASASASAAAAAALTATRGVSVARTGRRQVEGDQREMSENEI
jgi:hypothetical protein